MRWLVIAAILSTSCKTKREQPEQSDPPVASQTGKPALEGCDAVLTSADVEELCGAKTPIVADVLEKNERILCSRRGGPLDRWLALTIGKVADVAAAEKLTGGVAEGDVSVERQPSGPHERLVATARRGTVTMTLVTLVPVGKSGLCTEDQLTKMARRVYGRLNALD